MWQIKKHALNKRAFERMQGTYNSHAFASQPQTRDTHMSIGRSYRLTLYYMFLLPRKSFLIASFGTRIYIHTCVYVYTYNWFALPTCGWIKQHDELSVISRKDRERKRKMWALRVSAFNLSEPRKRSSIKTKAFPLIQRGSAVVIVIVVLWIHHYRLYYRFPFHYLQFVVIKLGYRTEEGNFIFLIVIQYIHLYYVHIMLN